MKACASTGLLHHLDESYRVVFTLRTLVQLSFRNIGDLFGKSDNWACVVFHRARAKIKEKWRNDHEAALYHYT